MAVARNGYTSLTILKAELGITDTNDDLKLNRIIRDASRWIDGYCRRHFYPQITTRTYAAITSSHLLLPDDLLTVTTLSTDDNNDGVYETTWAAGDYLLGPDNAANLSPPEPYYQFDISATGRYSFPVGVRRGVKIAGTFGYYNQTRNVGSLATAPNSTVTTITLGSNAADIGTGNLIVIDAEWMLVTDTAGSSRTIDRAINGATAAAHSSGVDVSVLEFPIIEQAALIQASRLFKRKDAAFGIVGAPDFGQSAVIARLDPDVRALLDDFRNESRRTG